MRRWLKATGAWIDHRSGLGTGLRRVFDERLPSGTSWLFTLGSVLLVLLILQLATGAVLTMYYVPTPDHAWDSVRYVTTEVTFGRLVRNLHFYGASFMVVVAVLHMLRVFFHGAYKAPRELTWITGVSLLLVVLAFALTGYLLPWDQRAYWATVVTINIARTAPLAGELVASILRGGDALGALTLSRWYSAHVILLPAAVVGLVVFHLFLMRRHHISGPITRRAPDTSHEFFPVHAVKDAAVVLGVFVALFTLAAVGRHELEPVANPEDATYVPRPEWYFLWLFQLLKYFPGRLEVIGAHVIPALLIALLLLLPFLDRRPERRPWRRPAATLSALIVIGAYCLTCHELDGEGAGQAPNLARAGRRHDADWLTSWISNPATYEPDADMPAFGGRLAPDDIGVLARYLATRH